MYLRWLTDSRRFNEWMNPVDYETEEYQKEQDALEQNQTTASRSRQGDGAETAGHKRKFSPGGDGGIKRGAARQRINPGMTAQNCCTCFYTCSNELAPLACLHPTTCALLLLQVAVQHFLCMLNTVVLSTTVAVVWNNSYCCTQQNGVTYCSLQQ